MKKLRIRMLLVDDSADDIDLLTRAVEKLGVPIDVDVVDDGRRALEFLRRAEPYVSAPRPDLVLLDLNMPRKNGFEVLQEMKEDEELSDIPVIVITTSNSAGSIERAYFRGASCFFTKPDTFEELKTVVGSVYTLWQRAEFPTPPDATEPLNGY